MDPRFHLKAIESEYGRYRDYAEKAVAQMPPESLTKVVGDSSVAMYLAHVSGNLTSRFTDFLTADGEKPWRNRDGEFELGGGDGDGWKAPWYRGWQVLFAALASLTDADLTRTVRIRGVELSVSEALTRSVAHTACHVGQVMLLGKIHAGEGWKSLSVPRGGSGAYNQNPNQEKGRP